jgi:hypothetical protein
MEGDGRLNKVGDGSSRAGSVPPSGGDRALIGKAGAYEIFLRSK